MGIVVFAKPKDQNSKSPKTRIFSPIIICSSKGSFISEGILTFVTLPKKVPNLGPEQKV